MSRRALDGTLLRASARRAFSSARSPATQSSSATRPTPSPSSSARSCSRRAERCRAGSPGPNAVRAAAGRAAWWAAIVQSAGTLFFNVTTYQAMHTALTSPEYDELVWRPDWRGSICFLVSGAIAYRASARHGWLPMRGGAGLVAAGSQPARLRLLRDLRCRRLRRPVDRVDARPGGRQLEHVAGRGLLPRLRARHPAQDKASKMPPGRRLHELERELEADLRG